MSEINMQWVLLGGLSVLLLIAFLSLRNMRPSRVHVKGKIFIIQQIAIDSQGAIHERTKLFSKYPKSPQQTSLDYPRIPANISKERTASNEKDAQTVIKIMWEPLQIGHYSDGIKGYQINCRVSIIDLKTKKTLQTKIFNGTTPNRRATGVITNTIYGDPPDLQKIAEFINSLTR